MVAAAGLLSDKNIEQLEKEGYEYIIGARIRSLSKVDREAVLELGLKGYVTNSKIRNKAIVENYRNLYFIERAFRMNKTDLAIRPIYHRLFNRIEAHVCICFTAYTIMLELERALRKTADKKNKKPGITIYRAKFLAESLYEIEYVNPYNDKKMAVMLRTDYDDEVMKLLDAIGLKL